MRCEEIKLMVFFWFWFVGFLFFPPVPILWR